MKAVKMGMPVYATDRKAGRVDDVLANGETGEPVFVVINAGGFFKDDVVVPYESVQNVTDARVWLALTRDEVKHAPHMTPCVTAVPLGWSAARPSVTESADSSCTVRPWRSRMSPTRSAAGSSGRPPRPSTRSAGVIRTACCPPSVRTVTL